MSKRKSNRDDDSLILLFTIDSPDPREITASQLKSVAPQFLGIQTDRKTFYLPVTTPALNAFLNNDEKISEDDTKLWLEVVLLRNFFKPS
jgi:hypothetical protein